MIKVPTMVVDQAKCRSKIAEMNRRITGAGVSFRPHFKTHQSRGIGAWFRSEGIRSITVSSVRMANYFADAGWEDIFIAFPFNPLEADALTELAQKAVVTIAIPGPMSAEIAAGIEGPGFNAAIEVDCGYHRSGTAWDDRESLLRTAGIISSARSLRLTSLFTHAGNTYGVKGVGSVSSVFTESVERLAAAKAAIGIDDLLLSAGDTPSASLLERFEGVDEMRPGNFVFHDLMQVGIGSATIEEVSALAVCPVVDIDRRSGRVVIYGGAVHLSKESIKGPDGPVYGLAARYDGDGWSFPWKDAYVTSLSQEHGLVSFPGGVPSEIRPGYLLGITPVHSCLAADLMAGYRNLEGEYIDHMNSRATAYGT